MKAETDLYCPGCWDKIYDKGDEGMSLFFPRSEERCSNCDTMLKRRRPGGQGDPWKLFATSRFECLKRELNELRESIAETNRKCQEYLKIDIDLEELGSKLDELIRPLESTTKRDKDA